MRERPGGATGEGTGGDGAIAGLTRRALSTHILLRAMLVVERTVPRPIRAKVVRMAASARAATVTGRARRPGMVRATATARRGRRRRRQPLAYRRRL